jgi:hypothetical protein
MSRLRAWWWRRRHAPFDWHIACPELLEPCHVRLVASTSRYRGTWRGESDDR